MNGEVHPWVTKQSQAEANAEFDRALEWLEHVVGINSEGRYRTYRATLSQVFRRVLEKSHRLDPTGRLGIRLR
jgi:hypothetical protein